MAGLSAVEWIARAEGVQVRVNTLDAGDATAWHWHSVVTDHVFGLDHGIEVALRAPDERVSLAPGQRLDIPPGRVHRVVNTTARALRYLLVQATGQYDFNEVP